MPNGFVDVAVDMLDAVDMLAKNNFVEPKFWYAPYAGLNYDSMNVIKCFRSKADRAP